MAENKSPSGEIKEKDKVEDEFPPKATRREEEEMGDSPPSLKLKGIKGGGIVQTAIVAFVVALLVFLGMGTMGGGSFLTKKDFERNLTGMVVTLEQVKTSVVQMQSTLNTAIQGIPNTVTMQVNNAISQITAKIDSANTKIAELTITINDLKTKLAVAETKNAGYETRIKALEDKVVNFATIPPVSGGGTAAGVTISVLAASSQTISGGGDYYYTLQVTNTVTGWKKVYIQATASVASGYTGTVAYTINTALTKFSSSTMAFADGISPAPYTMAFIPIGGANCVQISGISNSYLLMGGSVQIPVTFHLEYAAGSAVVPLQITFTSIVTAA